MTDKLFVSRFKIRSVGVNHFQEVEVSSMAIKDEVLISLGGANCSKEVLFDEEDTKVLTALSDPVRLKILSLIGGARDGQLCVCDLVVPTDKSQPTISHHLKVLSEAGLVSAKRQGRWIFYTLSRDTLGATVSKLEDLVQK